MKRFLAYVLAFTLVLTGLAHSQSVPISPGLNEAAPVGVVTTGNSRTALLSSNEVFTGTAVDVSRYAEVSVQIAANQDSKEEGVSLELSNDGTNWDLKQTGTYTALDAQTFYLPVTARYFRLVYTNTGIPLSFLRIQTVLHLTTTGGSDSGSAVTNAGTFAVQEDGAALTAQQAIQTAVEGTLTVSDGAGAMNVIVDSSATVTVTATNLDVQSGGGDILLTTDFTTVFGTGDLVKAEDAPAGGGDLGIAFLGIRDDTPSSMDASTNADYAHFKLDEFGGLYVRILGTGGAAFDPTVNKTLVDMGVDNDVSLNAGLLHANSPTTEIASFALHDGSADSDTVTNSFTDSKAFAISGTGTVTKVCLVRSLGTVNGEDGVLYFFDADPTLASVVADMTIAESALVVAQFAFTGTDYVALTTTAVNCQSTTESYDDVTHVAYFHQGATTLDIEDINLRVWIRRDS